MIVHQESMKGYTRRLVTCVSFITEATLKRKSETNNSALEFFNALYFLISWALKRWLAWRYKCLWLNGAQNITWLSGSLYLTTGKNEFTSVLSFFWLGKKNRLPQDASVCVCKYLLDHSQYVHSKLLELISHFCVNFLVNPPGRHITPYCIFFFFQNTSVWRTKILVELISIMLLKTHSKSDSHPNQKTWYSLHF